MQVLIGRWFVDEVGLVERVYGEIWGKRAMEIALFFRLRLLVFLQIKVRIGNMLANFGNRLVDLL